MKRIFRNKLLKYVVKYIRHINKCGLNGDLFSVYYYVSNLNRFERTYVYYMLRYYCKGEKLRVMRQFIKDYTMIKRIFN